MSQPSITPEACYAEIVAKLLGAPGVTGASDTPEARNKFGSTELKVRGKIFAMLVRGNLVVKIPRDRVDALIASGVGQRFDPRHDSRLMKEWATIDLASHEMWLPLAREALEFVGSKAK